MSMSVATSRPLALPLWALLLGLIALWLLRSQPSEHAVAKHGLDAWGAWDYLDSNPDLRRKEPCGDRPVWYARMPDGNYAVAVMTEGDWETARNVTTMILSPRHFLRFLRKCKEER